MVLLISILCDYGSKRDIGEKSIIDTTHIPFTVFVFYIWQQ